MDTEFPLVLEAWKMFGLAHTMNLNACRNYREEMKRRIALARTLILKPKVFINDEPPSGLGPNYLQRDNRIIEGPYKKKTGTSSLIFTHDVDCARVISGE